MCDNIDIKEDGLVEYVCLPLYLSYLEFLHGTNSRNTAVEIGWIQCSLHCIDKKLNSGILREIELGPVARSRSRRRRRRRKRRRRKRRRRWEKLALEKSWVGHRKSRALHL